MKFSEEQIKDIIAIKENLIQKIHRHQKEIDQLEKNLTILDLALKESSFTKASQLKPDTEKPKDVIPIKQGNNGQVIANAHVKPEEISIILDDQTSITEDTPPFRSFFIERIIGEMKKKDAQDGKDTIECIINNNGNNIKEIVIKNYKQKERVHELVNTITWALTRMLENK